MFAGALKCCLLVVFGITLAIMLKSYSKVSDVKTLPISDYSVAGKRNIDKEKHVKEKDVMTVADKEKYVMTVADKEKDVMTVANKEKDVMSVADKEKDVMTVAIYPHKCAGPYNWMPRDAFERCPSGAPKCVFVNNITSSDALLFTFHMLYCKRPHVPEHDNPRQKWIMHSRESQMSRSPVDSKFYNAFNATSSVMTTSNVPAPFGEIRRLPRPIPRRRLEESVWTARKNIAWLVSHCHTLGGREDYAKALSKHIDVTIYGGCAKKKCDKECQEGIQDRYKFYLSFENSVCENYVTEKLYRALTTDMIPIVYGMYDYKKYLPAKSFIDVRDFQSPKHLADYLHQVARNKTLYESHLEWKENFEAIEYDYNTHVSKAACGICDYLHKTKDEAPKTVNLETLTDRKLYCITKMEFLKNIGL